MVFLKSVLIEGALRPVDEVTAAYLRVKPGQKICPTCAKRSNINDGNAMETQETVVSFDVTDEKPPEAAIEEINKAAELLNCSPLKTSVGVSYCSSINELDFNLQIVNLRSNSM